MLRRWKYLKEQKGFRVNSENQTITAVPSTIWGSSYYATKSTSFFVFLVFLICICSYIVCTVIAMKGKENGFICGKFNLLGYNGK